MATSVDTQNILNKLLKAYTEQEKRFTELERKIKERYIDLKFQESQGILIDLILQPQFELQPCFKRDGKTYRKITYFADFQYKIDGKTYVEDVKGVKTEVYKLKKKLFLFKYPDINFIEI